MANLSSEIWSNDKKLRDAFSWLTRIGVAPKFGTMPIGYYQQDQCNAIADIKSACAAHSAPLDNLRANGGLIQAKNGGKWQTVAMIVCGKIVKR